MNSLSTFFDKKVLRHYSTRLIQGIYSGLLGREADQEALISWKLNLENGGSLVDLIREISNSEEFRKRTLQANSKDFITLFYQGILGRDPDDVGLKTYAPQILEWEDLKSTLRELGNSEEHWQRILGSHSEEFVGEIYTALLKRNPDEAGLKRYSALVAKKNGLGEVIENVLGSEEFSTKQRLKQINAGFNPNDLEQRKIVFLHLPKTGGTTLHHLLIQQTEPDCVCPERFNGLHAYPSGELAHYRLFSGHFDLVSTRLIPGRKAVITMFRDPVQRLVSVYNFQRAHRKETIESSGLELARLANQYSMADFFRVDEVRCHPSINNAMTRILTQQFPSWRWEYGVKISPEEQLPDLELALENLKSLDAFGIVEMYDESVKFMFSNLGLSQPEEIQPKMVLDTIVQEDPGLQAIVKEPVTEEVLGLMEDLVDADRQLYKNATVILREKMERASRSDL